MHYSGKYINFLKTGCQFYGSWPSDSNSPKWKLLFIRIMSVMHFANEFFGTIATINGLRYYYTGLTDHIKSFIEVAFMLETMFNMIYYQQRMPKFKVLTLEMESFLRRSNPHERIVKENYLKRIKVVCCALLTIFATAGTFFIISPLFTKGRVTPLNTVYLTIPIDRYWGRFVTYALNILHIVNAASLIFLDMLITSIIWYAACKFSLLKDTSRSTDEKELKMWIRRHQEAISYANKVNRVMAPLAIKSTVAVVLYVIVSCLVIIHDVPIFELSKFFLVTILSIVRYLSCSWSADELTEEARGVASEVWNFSIMNKDLKVRKEAIMIIQRCQKPVVIHSTGFLKAWSLNFSGWVLYSIFTYFTSLRAALHV